MFHTHINRILLIYHHALIKHILMHKKTVIKNSFEGKTKEYAIEHLQEVLNKFSLSLN